VHRAATQSAALAACGATLLGAAELPPVFIVDEELRLAELPRLYKVRRARPGAERCGAD
jgi:hypothetical protein